ncbi:phasin family protein [Sphingomonas sp.]|uniref:phasin family protein n=1 Tax=Sphingomonas sp. TaxID=28214 RepID=UPI0025DB3AE8|nr:phasin family protein [Sphingomonas sp.]
MADNEKFTDKATKAVKNAGKAMQDVAGKASENASALNGKVIDQAEENTRAAFAALRSAASVKSVQELAKIQGEFMKEASARSQAQIKEVGDLIAQFGKDTMAMFQPKKD